MQRERLIRLIQNDGRIFSQGGSYDGVDSDSVLPSEFSERIHHITTDDLEDNIFEDEEPNKVFDSFRNIVTTRDFRKLVEKSDHNIVLTAMIGMFMRNRERGSNSSCNFMTLTQRWFKKEDHGFSKTEKQKDAFFSQKRVDSDIGGPKRELSCIQNLEENGNKLFPCPDDL